MKSRYFLMSAVLLLATLALAAWFYPRLPAVIPTHWGPSGEADGFGPSATIFMWPALIAATMALFAVLPTVSPQKYGPENFEGTYWYIMLVLVGMFVYIEGAVLWAVLSGPVDMSRAMVGGVAVLLALIGNVMGKVRRNFWIGIRTPWTLASEKVWYATHRFAGKSMVLAAVLGVAGMLAGVTIKLCLAVIVGGAILPVIFSLVYYKRIERSGQLET